MVQKLAGQYGTYEQCKGAAELENQPYFGLQHGQPNGTAGCFVGGNIASIGRYGSSTNCTALDSAGRNIGGPWANYVYKRTGVPETTVSTPVTTTTQAEPRAIGCFTDNLTRTMTKLGADVTFDECKTAARWGQYQYFAMQDGKPTGVAECFASSNLSAIQQLGPSSACTVRDSAGRNLGGPWANSVFQL